MAQILTAEVLEIHQVQVQENEQPQVVVVHRAKVKREVNISNFTCFSLFFFKFSF